MTQAISELLSGNPCSGWWFLCLTYGTISGQAAAYKIGEQRILQLRRKFEAKEGRAYDLVNKLSYIGIFL